MFENAFWTHDYISGVDALFTKLRNGCAENAEILATVAQRIVIEKRYAEELAHSAHQGTPSADRGFALDSGAQLRQVFESTLGETTSMAALHGKIAHDLSKKVHDPFETWSQGHVKRITDCENSLRTRLAGYQKLLAATAKHQTNYIEKSQHKPTPDNLDPVASTIRIFRDRYMSTAPAVDTDNFQGKTVIAGLEFTRIELVQLLSQLIKDVIISSYRVPLLGTYQNVSSGANIASVTRRLVKNDSIAYSEKFGQSLVDQSLLKPVGQISNKFQISHSSNYQWQQIVFDLIQEASSFSPLPDPAQGIVEPGKPPSLSISVPPNSNSPTPETPILGADNDSDVESDPNPFTSPAEMPLSPELIAESEQYLQSVLELDVYRTEMELSMLDMFEYLEKCELDRIAAVRSALSDFSILSARPDLTRESQLRSLQKTKAIDPETELRQLVDMYQTGPLIPTVTVYRGYNNTFLQTFGVDLVHSRFFINLTLEYLAPLGIPAEMWLEKHSVREAYKLRSQVNTGRKFSAGSVYRFFSKEVVVGTFKQYLLELPESVIPFPVYDKVKEIYDDKKTLDAETDLAALVEVLVHIPPTYLSVLNKLLKVFSSYNDPKGFAKAMTPFLFRPRAVSVITQHDAHPQLFIEDLLRNSEELIQTAKDYLSRGRIADIGPSSVVSTPRRSISSPIFWSPHRSGRPQTPGSAGSSMITPNREVPSGTSLIPLALNDSTTPVRESSRRLSRNEPGSGPGMVRGLGILPIGGDKARPLQRVPSTNVSRHGSGSPT